jgi:hypothetical protein
MCFSLLADSQIPIPAFESLNFGRPGDGARIAAERPLPHLKTVYSGFTQRAPPAVCSCFQNGARVLSSSMR